MPDNGTNVGSVYFDVNLEDRVFQGKVKKQARYLENTFSKSIGKIGKALFAAFSVKAMYNFTKDSIKIGSDLAEVQNVVDVTFKDKAGEVNNFASNAIKQFGLTEIAAKKYTGTMGAMLKSMGLGTDKAKDMSISMAQLAGDLASFYNLETDEAFNKIRSGIAGEVEPLRQIGVNLSVANIEYYALTKGIQLNYEALTEQERALWRYNYLMSVTTDAQGDFARTSYQWANQVRVLTSQWESFKASMGQSFILLLKPIVMWLNTLMTKLIQAANLFNQFLQALTGRKNDASIGAVAVQAGDASDGISGMGDAAKKAGKKAKNALAGFDEINKLSKNASGAEDVVAGIGGISPGLGITDDGTGGAMGAISDKAQEMADKVKMAFDKLKNAILENKDIIIPALGAIGGALAGLAAYNVITNLIASFGLLKTGIKLAWAALLNHPMIAVAVAVGALIGAFITAYKTNDEFRESVDRVWEKIKNFLQPVIESLGKALTWLWQDVILPLSAVLLDMLKVAFEGVAYSVEWLWKYLFQPLGEFILAVFTPIIEALGKLLINVLKFAVDLVIKAFEFLWYSVLKPLINFLQVVFKPIFETVGKAIKDIIGGLQMTFEGFIGFISGVFTSNWRLAWEGVRTIFKGIFTSLWTIAKTPLNLIIDAINLIIEGLNSMSIDIPDWVPKFGGETWGISIPTIPKLAKGGIITQPTLAMVGERGKEAVMPLENNTGWITELAAMIASMLGNQGGGGDTTLVIKIGEDTIIEKVISGINRQSRISGKTTIEV